MDVKIAFLNRELDEVHMILPSGFENEDNNRKFCKLKKVSLRSEIVTKTVVSPFCKNYEEAWISPKEN